MAQLKVKQISDFVTAVGGIHDATVGAAAATAIAGVQSAVDANTLKVTNVTTNLAVTESTTTNIVTSSDGTDATLTAATTLKAGLMTKAIFDEHVANNAKVGITTDQADAIVANKDAIATEKGRINTLLAGSTAALDTFKEIEDFITALSTADVTVIEAISTAVENDAAHATAIAANATAISTNTTAIAGLDFTVNLSLTADATSNTVVNSKGTNAKLSGATGEDAGLMTAEDFRKLGGIEAGADVTDATNVQAAGALMDNEITNLAQVKAFASSDYATAAQGLLAASALQNASAFDAAGSADAAETAANGYTDTEIAALDLDLQTQITALAGVNSDEVVATFLDTTRFTVANAFDLNGHVAVFVNGLQVHESVKAEGWISADGLAFTVQNLGYDLESTDHIIVSGTLA